MTSVPLPKTADGFRIVAAVIIYIGRAAWTALLGIAFAHGIVVAPWISPAVGFVFDTAAIYVLVASTRLKERGLLQ